MRGLFVTATGTDIGKTMITGAIAAALKARGMNVGVFKPLASGGVLDQSGKLVAGDATFLMRAASIPERLRQEVNAVCLAPALTPAVAAKHSNVAIDMEQIITDLLKNAQKYDLVLVEGVGGITAPLWEDYLVVHLMQRLNLPAVIVSEAGLGAINHLVLTDAYAKSHQVEVKGIILNRWAPEKAGILEESNMFYMQRLTGLPLLGKMPLLKTLCVEESRIDGLAAAAEAHLDIDALLRSIG